MIETFMFSGRYQGANGKPIQVLPVFIPTENISDQQLKGIFQEYLDIEGRVPPDLIVLLGTDGIREKLKALSESGTINKSIPEFTRLSSPPPIRAISFQAEGVASAVTTNCDQLLKPAFLSWLQFEGLKLIFEKRGAILEPSGKGHFIKPTGEHCERFVRTANALIAGAETSFIALWLLRYLNRQIDFIYTDTAGIHSLALSASILRVQIDKNWNIPIVDSFSSYGGLSTYNFRARESSLFLISASTSGRLEEKLRTQLQVPHQNIVTVFYMSSRSVGDSQVLCDLSATYASRITEFTPYSRSDCPRCRSKIPAVAIEGDQFLIEYPNADADLIHFSNLPKWLGLLMQDFCGKGILRAHRVASPTDEKPRELFIDLAGLLTETGTQNGNRAQESAFLQRLDRQMFHIVPATLKHVVYLDDPISKSLAERLQNHMQTHFPNHQFSVVPHTQLPKQKIEESEWNEGTLMVVSGVVVTGQKMMEANQLLRNRKDDSIVYLAGLTRTRDKKRLAEIRENIQFGREETRHYPFYSIWDIYIPDDQVTRPSPWDIELDTWQKVQEWRASLNLSPTSAEESFDPIESWISNRMTELQQARVSGLTNALFLPDLTGNALELRNGFAFWPNLQYQEKYSQAEVYFTISAVLHAWREKHHQAIGLGSYSRMLISPRNFYRYNDGIIQACILRASDRGELDYRNDRGLASAMLEVIENVFGNFENAQGEALLEFLLAIAERRLTMDVGLISKPVTRLEEQLEELLKNNAGVIAGLAKVLCGFILHSLEERR